MGGDNGQTKAWAAELVSLWKQNAAELKKNAQKTFVKAFPQTNKKEKKGSDTMHRKKSG